MSINFINDHKCGFNLTNNLSHIFSKCFPTNPSCPNTFYAFNKILHEDENNKIIYFIRNPKDVIISGYNYHKICEERWCTNINGNYYDWWNTKFTDKEKESNRKYIEIGKNISKNICYQDKLKNLPKNGGIIHEMNNIGYITLSSMNEIPLDKPNTLIVKIEDLTYNTKETLIRITKFLNLDFMDDLFNSTNKILPHMMSDEEISKNIFITNKNCKKNNYLNYWNDELENHFNIKFPNIMQKFGYE